MKRSFKKVLQESGVKFVNANQIHWNFGPAPSLDTLKDVCGESTFVRISGGKAAQDCPWKRL